MDEGWKDGREEGRKILFHVTLNLLDLLDLAIQADLRSLNRRFPPLRETALSVSHLPDHLTFKLSLPSGYDKILG